VGIVRRGSRFSRRLRAAFQPSTVYAAWWTVFALREARRELRSKGLAATLSPPPRLPATANGAVRVVLRRWPSTCFERALVEQRWLAARGKPSDVVIGVARDDEGFAAHAWLDVKSARETNLEYQELLRLPPS
jgi:hypothetical protein